MCFGSSKQTPYSSQPPRPVAYNHNPIHYNHSNNHLQQRGWYYQPGNTAYTQPGLHDVLQDGAGRKKKKPKKWNQVRYGRRGVGFSFTGAGGGGWSGGGWSGDGGGGGGGGGGCDGGGGGGGGGGC
ncbi:hypothetical protein P168DRAFT_278513 [Aspergillus campestris IBT 28561]|uniref:Uncharacterized protein n=1 Tax=Aspergillus campestris (strain IBT 28561) TaxID=1392248 RepID=A0A2I1DGJ1_ASPC2|nr:uncharacterized protein P168DRAFT_278513 [Aspergillus campestris IBT 28561]PKY08989.1 hypothetical protein P168DRAFT_278513 [Aspergillus campestris IBT 28561]